MDTVLLFCFAGDKGWCTTARAAVPLRTHTARRSRIILCLFVFRRGVPMSSLFGDHVLDFRQTR